ncbi:hypothetical protein GA0115240_17049 [Streptomyces sp. DvalAA-14]|uniref:hypothetical protein n=1 Tax=unclassified Streptomyces TaxID=2593676 RepID=UPI00081BA814|nr:MULTISPECIES: hypothetical protein [unclassified Streptomyces]MYS24847.1 hypothetical protein [Streptomyces sp. SID4948]SCE49898.1 hypothetical protein GA0115240_17049 [Streptomyces sp. DvalAA-14]
MIQYLAGRRRLLVASMCAIAVATTLGWYAMEPVRPPCSYAVMTHGYTGLSERSWSEYRELTEQADRGYRQAIAAGRCDPPHARWHEWLD